MTANPPEAISTSAFNPSNNLPSEMPIESIRRVNSCPDYKVVGKTFILMNGSNRGIKFKVSGVDSLLKAST